VTRRTEVSLLVRIASYPESRTDRANPRQVTPTHARMGVTSKRPPSKRSRRPRCSKSRVRSWGFVQGMCTNPECAEAENSAGPTKRLAPPAGVDSEWTESSSAGRSQRRTTEAAGRSQPATGGLGNHCSSPNRATSAISSDHDSTYDHSVSVVTTPAISLNVHKPACDVLALGRELAVASSFTSAMPSGLWFATSALLLLGSATAA